MDRSKRSLGVIGGMTLALFAAQAVFMKGNLAHIAGWGGALALSALYAFAAFLTLLIFDRLEKPQAKTMLGVSAFVAVAMFARVTMLDFVSADYDFFLKGWVDVFREGGNKMLAEKVGDYNLIYQYVLLLISGIPLKDLYLIKLFSVIFDGALALAMMRAAGFYAGEKAKIPVFLTVLALPTVLLDGACWAQCDSVYVFFIVLCLLLLEKNRPLLSAASLAVAFAFKLQTIFFFPVVLLGLIHKRYRGRDAAMFFIAYLITLLPALLAGRSLLSAISVYASQSMGQYYDRLTYHAPNLYMFFPQLVFGYSQEAMWMRYIEGIDVAAEQTYLSEPLMIPLQNAALAACVILTLIVVVYWLIHYKEITPEMTLEFALFFALFLPFVMPKMHDRYFYLADLLSVLYAARHKNRRFVPVLVIGASLMCYVPYLMRQRPIDMRWLALMMLAALMLVGRDLLAQMRKNRAAMKGGEAA